MSYDHTPKEEKPIQRVSETSKYFGKKKFKSGDYTKTDSEGRNCLYNAKHRFIRYLPLLLLMFLLSCQKDPVCKTVIIDTYSNYQGYWDYCRHASNEIDAELVYIKSDTVTRCDAKDTVFYRPLVCPRSGFLSYTIRQIVR